MEIWLVHLKILITGEIRPAFHLFSLPLQLLVGFEII